MRLTESQIDDVRARADCADVARELGAVLRRVGTHQVGSCPLCGGGKRATRFEAWRDKWVCAVCCEGGDAIKLVEKATGRAFREAVEFLGGARALTPAESAELAGARDRRMARDAQQARDYREKARRAGFEIWRSGAPLGAGDACVVYLLARGVDPAGLRLRGRADMPYYDGENGREIWRGPALLGALIRPDGTFGAVHMTFVDAARPGQKARIAHPDTGEILPVKKMRGVKKGSAIALAGPRDAPARLFLGEGIETVASVREAFRMEGALRDGDAFWAAGDLGNIGGAHVDTIAHPSLKSPKGRALRVAGPVPDFDAPAIAVPDSVAELVLLGDGDSDRFTTDMSLKRARARYARPGRLIRIAWADDGRDFNDMWREDEAAA